MFSNDSASIHIEQDRQTYNSGDQVQGSIYLNILEDYQSSYLALEIVGYEKVTFFNKQNPESDTRKESIKGPSPNIKTDANYILEHQFLMPKFNDVILGQAQYQVPFTFILPEKIPSTFYEQWYKDGSASAFTSYLIKTVLESTDQYNFPTIEKTIKMHIDNNNSYLNLPPRIYTSLDQDDNDSDNDENVQHFNIRNWCLFNSKCTTSLKLKFEKQRYMPGEIAILNIDVDNTKCKKSIKDIKGELIQRQTVNTNDYKKVQKITNNLTTVYTRSFIKAGKEKNVRVEIPLGYSGVRNTTCEGKLINNGYEFRMTIIYNNMINACCKKGSFVKIDLDLYNIPEIIDVNGDNRWVGHGDDWNPIIFQPYVCKLEDNNRTSRVRIGTDADMIYNRGSSLILGRSFSSEWKNNFEINKDKRR